MRLMLIYCDLDAGETWPGLRVEYFESQSDAFDAYGALMDKHLITEAQLFEVTQLASFRKNLIPDYYTGAITIEKWGKDA